VLKRIKKYLKRDQDISYHIEFIYIYITIKETIDIISSHLKNATLQFIRRLPL
jgi:hypothetical protein